MIYETRPIECRVLKCWDPDELERIYTKNRLTRRDILERISWLWEIIAEHEKWCAYAKIEKLVQDLHTGRKNSALEGLCKVLRYDEVLRSLVVEKCAAKPDHLEFLFGRPLTATLRMFDLKVEKRGEAYCLRGSGLGIR
jgi:hypothetical protein